MTLTPAKKTILALLWVWPPVYAVFFNVVIMTMFTGSQSPGFGSEANFLAVFAVLMVFHLGTMASMLGQMVFYIWHVATQNHQVKAQGTTGLVLWITMFVMFGLFAIPIYWYKYIRHDLPPQDDVDAVLHNLS